MDKTFTVGFADKQYDETDYAREFSEKIGVKNFALPHHAGGILGKHRQYPVPYGRTAGRRSLGGAVLRQPGGRQAGQGLPVRRGGRRVFSAGYNIYKEPFTVSWYDKLPLWLRRAIGAAAECLPPVHGVNFLVRRGRPLEERYIGNTNLMGERRKKQLLRQYSGAVKPTDLSRPLFEQTKGQDPVTRMEYCDLNLWMVGDILLKADKMSMANSLELRVPFLDRKVFELACRIPTEHKVNAGQTKIAMRGAAEKTIPARTADKKKLGFPVPVRAWLRDETYAARRAGGFQRAGGGRVL